MLQPFRQSRRTRGRRPRAFALSVLLVGLQLLALAHLTLERHGVCWEHGTVTELQSAPVGAPLVVSGDVVPGLHAGSSAGAVEGLDGHHHCPVQASRRNWGAPPSGFLVLPPSGLQDGAVARTATEQRADAGLLLRAPKQSPPQSA